MQQINSLEKMKTKSIISIAAIIITLSACGNSSNNVSQTDTNETKIDPNKIQDIPEYGNSDTITIQGSLYTYEFKFHNDKKNPVIINSEGYKYHENYADLNIYKGKTDEIVYSHTFTKESFKQYIPEKIQSQSTLVGFNFNYMELGKHDKFHFIAVVGDPDETTDIAYSIAIDLSKNFDISTHIVNDVDTEPISDNMNIDPDDDDA